MMVADDLVKLGNDDGYDKLKFNNGDSKLDLVIERNGGHFELPDLADLWDASW